MYEVLSTLVRLKWMCALMIGLWIAAWPTVSIASTPSHQRSRKVNERPIELKPKMFNWLLHQRKRAGKVRAKRVALAASRARQGHLYVLPPDTERSRPTKTLSWVYQQAQKRNIRLRILKQELILAQISRAQSWSVLHPTINATGTYTRNQVATVLDFGGGDPVETTPQNQLSLGIQMQWKFIDFRAISSIHIAQLVRQQVGRTLAQTRRDLYQSVGESYYNVLLAQGSFHAARNAWKNALQHYKIAQTRTQAGLSTRLAKMQAQLDVVRAQQDWMKTRNQLRNSRLTLALLLGRKQFRFRAIRPKRLSVPKGAIQSWTKHAVRYRHELKAKKLALQIAQKKQHEAWLAFLPTLSLSSGVNVSNAAGFTGQNTQWNLGVNIQWNLYSGGVRTLALRRTTIEVQKARLEYRQLKDTIANQIRTLALNLQNAHSAIHTAQHSTQLARATYQLRQQHYQAGMGTPISISDANKNLLSSEIQYIREVLNREIVTLRLLRAIGVFQPK